MKRARSILLLLVFLVPASAFAHEIADQAQCRLSFGNSVRDLAAVTALRVEICHRQRLIGDLAPAIDCNAPSGWSMSGYADGARGIARDLDRYAAESANCTRGIATPAEVGHLSCPAPCDAMPVGTFPELGECLKCITLTPGLPTLADTLGTPPAPSSKLVRKCQETIGRGIVRYLNKRMKLQHACQFLKDIADPEFAALDCADLDDPAHPYAPRSERARSKFHSQLERRCGEIDFASNLDTCGSDPSSESACVLAALDAWTDTMLAAIFPPQ